MSDNEIALLKEKWNEKGGHKVIPWYKWVLQNTTLSVSCD